MPSKFISATNLNGYLVALDDAGLFWFRNPITKVWLPLDEMPS